MRGCLSSAAATPACRYYDAARSYGRAEEFLAGWLDSRGITPGQVLVGSKWGYTYTAGACTRAPLAGRPAWPAAAL